MAENGPHKIQASNRANAVRMIYWLGVDVLVTALVVVLPWSLGVLTMPHDALLFFKIFSGADLLGFAACITLPTLVMFVSDARLNVVRKALFVCVLLIQFTVCLFFYAGLKLSYIAYEFPSQPELLAPGIASYAWTSIVGAIVAVAVCVLARSFGPHE